MSRPALGTPSVGDPVFVREGGGRHTTTTPATIIAVGRVWLTLKANGSGREWRMRKDKQSAGTGIGYESNFATPEQFDYDRRAVAAYQFLRDQGIDVRLGSPWHGSAGNIALADLIRQATSDTGSKAGDPL